MYKLTAVFLALTVATGCAQDVGEGKVKAEVHDVPAVEEKAAATQAAADPLAVDGTALKIDKARSEIGGTGAKVSAQHPFVVHEFEGRVGMDGDTVKGLAFTAQAATIDSGIEKLDVHLRKEDFLFVDQHPQATFRSTEIKAGSDAAGMTHTVTGDLTIRGKTKRVTFPAKVEVSPAEVKASTEFVINRQDFDIRYPGKADDLVQDNVAMRISFVAPRTP